MHATGLTPLAGVVLCAVLVVGHVSGIPAVATHRVLVDSTVDSAAYPVADFGGRHSLESESKAVHAIPCVPFLKWVYRGPHSSCVPTRTTHGHHLVHQVHRHSEAPAVVFAAPISILPTSVPAVLNASTTESQAAAAPLAGPDGSPASSPHRHFIVVPVAQAGDATKDRNIPGSTPASPASERSYIANLPEPNLQPRAQKVLFVPEKLVPYHQQYFVSPVGFVPEPVASVPVQRQQLFILPERHVPFERIYHPIRVPQSPFERESSVHYGRRHPTHNNRLFFLEVPAAPAEETQSQLVSDLVQQPLVHQPFFTVAAKQALPPQQSFILENVREERLGDRPDFSAITPLPTPLHQRLQFFPEATKASFVSNKVNNSPSIQYVYVQPEVSTYTRTKFNPSDYGYGSVTYFNRSSVESPLLPLHPSQFDPSGSIISQNDPLVKHESAHITGGNIVNHLGVLFNRSSVETPYLVPYAERHESRYPFNSKTNNFLNVDEPKAELPSTGPGNLESLHIFATFDLHRPVLNNRLSSAETANLVEFQAVLPSSSAHLFTDSSASSMPVSSVIQIKSDHGTSANAPSVLDTSPTDQMKSDRVLQSSTAPDASDTIVSSSGIAEASFSAPNAGKASAGGMNVGVAPGGVEAGLDAAGGVPEGPARDPKWCAWVQAQYKKISLPGALGAQSTDIMPDSTLQPYADSDASAALAVASSGKADSELASTVSSISGIESGGLSTLADSTADAVGVGLKIDGAVGGLVGGVLGGANLGGSLAGLRESLGDLKGALKVDGSLSGFSGAQSFVSQESTDHANVPAVSEVNVGRNLFGRRKRSAGESSGSASIDSTVRHLQNKPVNAVPGNLLNLVNVSPVGAQSTAPATLVGPGQPSSMAQTAEDSVYPVGGGSYPSYSYQPAVSPGYPISSTTYPMGAVQSQALPKPAPGAGYSVGGIQSSYGAQPVTGNSNPAGGSQSSYGAQPVTGNSNPAGGSQSSYGPQPVTGNGYHAGGSPSSYGAQPGTGTGYPAGGSPSSYGAQPVTGNGYPAGGSPSSYGAQPGTGTGYPAGGSPSSYGAQPVTGNGYPAGGSPSSYGARPVSGISSSSPTVAAGNPDFAYPESAATQHYGSSNGDLPEDATRSPPSSSYDFDTGYDDSRVRS